MRPLTCSWHRPNLQPALPLGWRRCSAEAAWIYVYKDRFERVLRTLLKGVEDLAGSGSELLQLIL